MSRLERIPSLDGVRGLAALCVVLAHNGVLVLTTGAAALGGVMDAFFCLSGFLVGRMLLAAQEGREPIARFYGRRAARIIPAHWIACCVVAWLVGPGTWAWLAAVYATNPLLFFVGQKVHIALAPTWSLCVEEQFYLLLPLAIYRLSRERLQTVLFWCVAAPLAVLMFSPDMIQRGWLNADVIFSTFPFRLPALAAGVLLALHEMRLRENPGTLLRWGAWAVAAGAGLSYGGTFADARRGMIAGTCLGVGVIMLALWAHWVRFRPATDLLGCRLLRGLGTISLGLYVYHFPITFFLCGSLPFETDMARHVASVVIAVAAATVSWFVIERPILRLRDHWSRVHDRRVLGPSGRVLTRKIHLPVLVSIPIVVDELPV